MLIFSGMGLYFILRAWLCYHLLDPSSNELSLGVSINFTIFLRNNLWVFYIPQ